MKYAVKLSVRNRVLWVVSLYRHPHNKTEAVEWYMGRGKPASRFIVHGPAEDPRTIRFLVRSRYMRGYVAYGGGK